MSETPRFEPHLWTERSVEETLSVYKNWAASYDEYIAARGYRTPARIANMLTRFLPAQHGPVLDYGCGTGVSGEALANVGLGPLHGTDISQEMIAVAESKGVYERLWKSEPEEAPARAGDYAAIVAAGVISVGAAPPETVPLLTSCLAPGGLLVFSFNDPNLADGRFDACLQSTINDGTVAQVARETGPHLENSGMNADVILLRRL